MASPGAPHWAGSREVAESVGPRRLALTYGAWISSRKRSSSHPLSRRNPGSDHNSANRSAYAIDFATFNGERLARAIARKLGISHYSTGNFNTYTIWRRGAAFAVQILWAVDGHFNHVHLGVRLIHGNYRMDLGRPTMRPRRRSYGRHGRFLKRALRRRGHKGLWVRNGYYRPGSRAVQAVKRFQRNHNLRPDGVVGPKTWRKLGD